MGGKTRSPFDHPSHSDQSLVQRGRSLQITKPHLLLSFLNAVISWGKRAITLSCSYKSNSPHINCERVGEASCLTQLFREELYLPLKYRKQWSEMTNLVLRINVSLNTCDYGKGFISAPGTSPGWRFALVILDGVEQKVDRDWYGLSHI